jgi:uncharacterized repeat protein (TIGR03803 family)
MPLSLLAWGNHMLNGIELRHAGMMILFTAAAVARAQTFTVLDDFVGTNGAEPFYMSMVQGLDGNLYGTTSGGGPKYGGIVFKVTPEGSLTTVYNACPQLGCLQGYGLSSGLALATDGNFYGFTEDGGVYNYGVIYRITPAGKWTTLHSFNGADGVGEYSVLVQGTDGSLYGVTPGGGANGFGTAFKITLRGVFTTLYSFCAQTGCADGEAPYAGLVQARDGNFYGTTLVGGAYNYGTVFKMTPGGGITTLYSFCSQPECTDGYAPHSPLVEGSDGNLYGTTVVGGTGGGTAFRITTSGTMTTLYTFCDLCSAGGAPVSGLVQGTDGNFYGTTVPPFGAPPPYGAIFRMTPNGEVTFMHGFNGTDGSLPYGGLVQATDGKFYGTTNIGGPSTRPYGTIYSLAMGLGPFVTSVPGVGSVGEPVKILGTDLTGATAVTFNGIAAPYTVISATEISTYVPPAATTGKVTVTTPNGTLVSNADFRVRE